jgi:hypothetical protein
MRCFIYCCKSHTIPANIAMSQFSRGHSCESPLVYKASVHDDDTHRGNAKQEHCNKRSRVERDRNQRLKRVSRAESSCGRTHDSKGFVLDVDLGYATSAKAAGGACWAISSLCSCTAIRSPDFAGYNFSTLVAIVVQNLLVLQFSGLSSFDSNTPHRSQYDNVLLYPPKMGLQRPGLTYTYTFALHINQSMLYRDSLHQDFSISFVVKFCTVAPRV